MPTVITGVPIGLGPARPEFRTADLLRRSGPRLFIRHDRQLPSICRRDGYGFAGSLICATIALRNIARAWARHWTEASRFEVPMSLSLRFERQRDCYVLPFLFVGHRDSNWYYAAVGWLWWRMLVET